MKNTNKITKNRSLILLFIITLIILLMMICYYCYYYFYSIPKRKKNNVKTRMRVLTELYTMVVDIANENNVKPFYYMVLYWVNNAIIKSSAMTLMLIWVFYPRILINYM